MDEIDFRILREVQYNARISNAELAKHIGLSQSPCWHRLRNLESSGAIERYVAIFSQTALGIPDTVIIEVTLDRHDDDTLERFGASLARLPEVIEAYLTTGEYDYYVRAAVSGTSGYERFLRERLYKIPGIRHTRSSFALRCLKQTYSVTPPREAPREAVETGGRRRIFQAEREPTTGLGSSRAERIRHHEKAEPE